LEDRIESGELRVAVEALIGEGGVDLIWPPSE
jgi:hypothetical protein